MNTKKCVGLAAVFVFALGAAGQATDLYWVSSTASVWSAAENWDTATNGPGGAGVPGAGDTASFGPYANGVCQIDVNPLTLGVLSVVGYTGHLDAATTDPNIAVTGSVQFASGANGIVSLGDGTWTVGGDFDYLSQGGGGRVLNRNASTVFMYGTNVFVKATYYQSLWNLTIASNAFVSHVSNQSSYRVVVANNLDVFGTLSVGYAVPENLSVYASGRVTGPGYFALSYSPGIRLFEPGGVIDCSLISLNRPDGTGTLPPGHYQVTNLLVWGETYTVTWKLTNGVYDIDGMIWMYQNNNNGAATLDCTGAVVRVGGGLTNSANAVITTPKSRFVGAVTLTGATDRVVDLNTMVQQPAIAIAMSTGTVTLLSGISNASLTVTGGRLNPNGQTIRTSGDLWIGSNAQVQASGLNGAAFLVGGNAMFCGEFGTRLSLEATAPWTLAVAGTGTASYVKASYSDAAGGSQVRADDSRDLGNNLNWRFVPGGTVISLR